eukprot:725742-Karenia_brevis.AAC.1
MSQQDEHNLIQCVLECFADVLLAGFDETQQSLLKVLSKQRQHAIQHDTSEAVHIKSQCTLKID